MQGTYDHIIVGAGSAGALLAARLSEDPRTSVLLLEAGPDHRSADTPKAVAGPNFFAAVAEPGRMWPELTAVHADGQEPMPYVRGRGAGGSSAVNAMIVIRGLPADYDRWAGELGCAGWDAERFAALFERIEEPGGPLPLRRLAVADSAPLDRALHAAAVDLGYPDCPDVCMEGATGVGPAAMNVRDGRRVSTNDAYLEPVRSRANLEVRGDALADRVLLDGRRARGVRLASGEEIEARAVTVSAGAIHSPAILLRSGVGDGLPVGENLVEHPMVPVALVMREGSVLGPGHHVLSTLVRYSSELGGAGPGDMQILPVGVAGPAPDLAGVGLLGAAAMQVFSRGRVALCSEDPAQDPLVEFRMLSDERDRVRLRDGVRRLRDLATHPAIAAICETALAGEAPLAALGDDDASLDAYLDAAVTNYVHAVGTCRMGDPGDPAAVVDPACRVLGHEGLRVVDASVMPDIPRANTHLTTLAIAEAVA